MTTYISTSLDIAELNQNDEIIRVANKRFIRLTPSSWAWAKSKYDIAICKCAAGQMPGTTFANVLHRMNRVYKIALAQYGRERIELAVKSQNGKIIDRLLGG